MENLKKIRKQYNLSQQKLADILHISQQSVYKYENNITTPDIDTLIHMADYFNTSIDYLVDYTNIPHKIEPVKDTMLNEDEMILVNEYRKLPLAQKSVIKSVLSGYITLINNQN